MSKFYIILLVAYILKTIAGIPLLLSIYTTGETEVIPYSTLILMMTSGLLLLYTALTVKYYLHAVIYGTFFSIYALIFIIKFSVERGSYIFETQHLPPKN